MEPPYSGKMPEDIDQKLDRILAGQARLFWLITQTPGVACYASDVLWFCQNEVNFGNQRESTALITVNGYRKGDTPIETLILK